MKNIIIILIILAILLLGVFYFLDMNQPDLQSELEDDTTASIEADLDEVDLGDLDKEFESIDQDLNSL